MATWYVGGTAMSRSSSASSLPDDRVIAGTGAPPRWVEAGKRRVSFTEPLEPGDGWSEGFGTEGRALGFFGPQVKRPRRHVNHHYYYLNEHSSRSATELDRILPPAFYVIREAEGERSRVETSSPPSHARKSTSGGYDDRLSTNYAVADAFTRDYGGTPHTNNKTNNNQYNNINDITPPPQPGLPPPVRSPVLMEKTLSGLSISSDTDYDSYVEEGEQQRLEYETGAGAGVKRTALMTDDQAARLVEQHLAAYRQRNRNSQHERILKSLICPRAVPGGHDQFEIDDEALQGIFYAANELFFQGRLKGRVTWDWSSTGSNSDSDSEGADGSGFSAHSKYRSKIIGTTALRRAGPDMGGGYETLIVLSQPILKDRRYNRRLLISTFLHELIHSYLFVCCGFAARKAGGHTDGFRRIARLIDRWVGPQILYLCNMEADLKDFLVHSSPAASAGDVGAGLGVMGHRHPHHQHRHQHQHHVLDSCQVMWPTDDGSLYVHTPPVYHPQVTSWPVIR